MRSGWYSLLLAAVLIPFIVSCGGLSNQMKSLDQTIRGYEKTIRWSKFDMARSFRKGPQEMLTETELKRLANIRITGYEPIHTDFSPDKTTAHILVRIRYYNEEYAVERTITDRQTWVYDEESSRWYLESLVPSFR